jgi:hypothetical protein
MQCRTFLNILRFTDEWGGITVKRNRLNVITCALFAALLLSSCQSSDLPNSAKLNKTPKKLETFYPASITEVDSIEIRSGSDGTAKRTADPKLMHDWIEKVRYLNIIPNPDQEDTSGVLFHVRMFRQEEVVFWMTPTNINQQRIEPQDELADLMTELYNRIE